MGEEWNIGVLEYRSIEKRINKRKSPSQRHRVRGEHHPDPETLCVLCASARDLRS